ncbi:MAG: type I restriction-modification system endonuclease [Oscillospiraceae bacterium]|jgi:type I restriction enzyme R subunit|nr:type I restriction-modification system endonuclease [Oscillospiraceae bacterium]
MSNFIFLADEFPELEKLGALAEGYLYTDPNSCLFKIGSLAEAAVKQMMDFEGMIAGERETHADKIKMLKYRGVIERDIEDILHLLRQKRNKAAHDGYDCFTDAKRLLQMSHTFCCWFMECYGYYEFTAKAFIMPEDPRKKAEYLEQEHEHLLQKHEKLLVELEQIKTQPMQPSIPSAERKQRKAKATANLKLSETETRLLIDEQLRKVGWEADTDSLRYSKGTRPQKGRNIAIAEWPTNSDVCKFGSVDYALFAGVTLVGVIEAKPVHKNISSVIDNQCKDYSRGIKAEHTQYVINTWGDYKAPFLFATNGRPYLKQLEIMSGIWFRDARQDSNMSKSLQGWFSPQGMLEMLDKDIEASNQKLMETPYDLMHDKDGLNLRPYQLKAVEKAEEAVIDGKQTALLAMATGTGKTRTVLGMIYRFLKSGRFNRVLFLVDRTTLGEQAQDVFKEVKIEELMTLDEIYNVNTLDDKDIEKETKIHVATVQGMVKRILYNESDSIPSASDYDLIVIDEAHRGYILDKEMGEDEQLYRNQNDYVSKYRTVVEYFDAAKIALTATPALHTTQIFGKPVYEYSYRDAVVDGFLVDHDAPHIIETKLSTEGIVYKPGETVAIYDQYTGEITNSDELEDELEFDVETFNRKVITENFNRTVLETISDDLNPEGEGKTLIFAVDDNHADLIVKILKEIFEPTGVPNDAIMKITGSIGGGNSKKVLEVVKRFKNEQYPNVAVTVDLLTTGIDVPEITTLIFLRRIKSRILFEQMLGRATRLCPEINKTHFEIYDAVGVYESLVPVNTMKPVVQNESSSFDDLLNGLDVMETEGQVKNQVDMIIAKLHRKKRNMSAKDMEQFIDVSGGINPTQFAEKINGMTPSEAKDFIAKNNKLFEILGSSRAYLPRHVIISNHDDELVSHTRGYGNGKTPQDYLEEFNAFINDNMNIIAALTVVCTRPQELTRESLKSLKLELDRNNFTEQQLNTAWRELKNEEIAADIISYIRRYALGTELISREERIKRGVEKLRKIHNFTKQQLDWLARMEKTLIAESVIDREVFDTGAFKAQGGYARIDKVFAGKLSDYLKELNTYLYEDGGLSA